MLQRLKLLKAFLGVYLNQQQGMAFLERVQASNLSEADRALVTRIIRATLKLPDAPGQEGLGEVVEGALAAVTPVAFAAGAVVVLPPGIDVLALAPGTLEWPIFPPQRMNVGLTLVDVEELVDV
jgi:hypothetical protein